MTDIYLNGTEHNFGWLGHCDKKFINREFIKDLIIEKYHSNFERNLSVMVLLEREREKKALELMLHVYFHQ
jgi:hypothetical protein